MWHFSLNWCSCTNSTELKLFANHSALTVSRYVHGWSGLEIDSVKTGQKINRLACAKFTQGWLGENFKFWSSPERCILTKQLAIWSFLQKKLVHSISQWIHEKLTVFLVSALILYCATGMFWDTRNISPKMSFFVRLKSPILSKISWKFLIFIQNCDFCFSSKMLNFVISFVFHPKRIVVSLVT